MGSRGASLEGGCKEGQEKTGSSVFRPTAPSSAWQSGEEAPVAVTSQRQLPVDFKLDIGRRLLMTEECVNPPHYSVSAWHRISSCQAIKDRQLGS